MIPAEQIEQKPEGPGQDLAETQAKQPGQQAPDEAKASEKAAVKLWAKRIKEAKRLFKPDFERMRDNMNFAAGVQYKDQRSIETNKYISNLVLKAVNSKVAGLYARDPKAVARRRKRMDYQLYDGNPATLMQAQIASMQGQQLGMPNMGADAILTDFMQGHQWEQMVEKVCRTMEITYGYQCDSQAPEFKYQMKQLVRRTVTTGVGYVRLNFSRQFDHTLTSTATDDSLSMRAKRLERLTQKAADGDIMPEDQRMEQIKMLAASLVQSVNDGDQTNVEERLEFDFPPSTSIIVDPRCRALKGFIGAHWIAQQYIMPLEDVNAFFETDIKAGGELIKYNQDGQERVPEGNEQTDKDVKPLACLWEVFSLDTKSKFYIADGHSEWVSAPEPVTPSINRFWPVFALTFNDIEIEQGQKASIYPPSDVELMKSAQREWNRTREALREHRIENTPFYCVRKGVLSDNDKDKLTNHKSGEVIELEGLQGDMDINKVIMAFRPAPIDPALYQTQPLEQDIQLAVGAQQANLGPTDTKGTATGQTISEQSRISVTSSNVDDLDDLLSDLAKAAGEMMLREFSEQTVKRIAGQGAVWPTQNREDFLNEILLDVVASSSGRPNKAIEIANFERIAPFLLNAGANPWGVIKEGIQRLDDRLDVSDFAPQMPPTPPGGAAQPAGKGKVPGPNGPQGQQSPGQPQNGGQPSVPLAGMQG